MALDYVKRIPAVLPAISDVRALRERARTQIEKGAVTASYPKDKDRIVQLLNEALATELVCVLR
jgi:bacterioferritin